MVKSIATASVAAFFIFVVIDFIWLSNAGRLLYRPQLGSLLLDRPGIPPAIMFYILYGIGLTLLVVRPAVESGSLAGALWMGALFGLVAYGTYDLTNAATLRGWSWTVTVVDMAWGAFLTGVSTFAGVWLARLLG
ncbi:MAG: hypothetical protein CL566_09605 [Alphaproteobacteria bacterium]|nr:hypothetical protein [Alphaproteobacteria bacterium]